MSEPVEVVVRLDKWLWAARCFKTRALAAEACEQGRCEVDERPAKAGQRLRVGQRVVVRTPGGERVLEVRALSDRRGPAEAARQLFVDHSPPPPPRDPLARLLAEPVFVRERGSGRPTKRDRRRLDQERRG